MRFLSPEERKRILDGGATEAEVDEYEELVDATVDGPSSVPPDAEYQRKLERLRELFHKFFGRDS